LKDKTNLSTFGIIYVNALIALPLAFVLMLITGDIDRLLTFEHLGSHGFWWGFGVSCAMGLLLTYSSILCTTYNSPLATSVTGNAKDIITTLMGWFIFSGFIATAKSVGGILISFVGAFMYSYASLQKSQKAAAAESAARGTGSGSPAATDDRVGAAMAPSPCADAPADTVPIAPAAGPPTHAHDVLPPLGRSSAPAGSVALASVGQLYTPVADAGGVAPVWPTASPVAVPLEVSPARPSAAAAPPRSASASTASGISHRHVAAATTPTRHGADDGPSAANVDEDADDASTAEAAALLAQLEGSGASVAVAPSGRRPKAFAIAVRGRPA